MKRVVLHIDVNSAFLSWSAVKELSEGIGRDLREIPSAVGGDEKSRKGIVVAKSIPAKRYGVKTGEPLYSARLKCPELVTVRGDSAFYREMSQAFFRIVQEYSDRASMFSIDECFVEYTGMEQLFGDPIQAAYEIKDRIKRELGFTVNIGVGSNKLLAKMAGDFEKPDKVHVVFQEDVPEKLWPLPVEDLFLCGRQTTKALKSMGITTIGALAHTDVRTLRRQFKSMGDQLWRFANGIDDGVVRRNEDREPPKSVSMSRTLPKDIKSYEEADTQLLCLTESVCKNLRETGCRSSVVSVFIKNSDFIVYGAQQKLFQPTDCTNIIFDKVREIFRELWKGDAIRLLGVRVSDFEAEGPVQLNLWEWQMEKYRMLDHAVDNIRDRYGYGAVFRGALAKERNIRHQGSAFNVDFK